jgi:pilus assembly protein FimV
MSSSQKFIARNRAPRVQIEYDVELYGAQKKVQLPFVMGVMSDLSGKAEKPVVADRSFLEIDVDNFDDRLKAIAPKAQFTVPNTLTGEGNLAVDLTFTKMSDFSPEAIADNVVSLKPLLDARRQLSDLMAYMDGKSGAEALIENLLTQPNLLKVISGESSSAADTDAALESLRAMAPVDAPAADTTDQTLAALAQNAPEEAAPDTQINDVLAALPTAIEAEVTNAQDSALDALRAAPVPQSAPEDTSGDILANLAATPVEEPADEDTAASVLDGIARVEEQPELDTTADVLSTLADTAVEVTAQIDTTADVLSEMAAAAPETVEVVNAIDGVLSGIDTQLPDAPEDNALDDALNSIDTTAPEAAPDTTADDILGSIEAAEEAPEDDGLDDILSSIEAVADVAEDPSDSIDNVLMAVEAAEVEEVADQTDDILAGLDALDVAEKPAQDLDALLADIEAPADVLEDNGEDILADLSAAAPEDAPEEDALSDVLAGIEITDTAPEEDATDDILGSIEAAEDAPEDDGLSDVLAGIEITDIAPEVDATDDILGSIETAEQAPEDDGLDDILSSIEVVADASEDDGLDALLADIPSVDAPDATEEAADDLDALLADMDAPVQAPADESDDILEGLMEDTPEPADDGLGDDLDDLLGDLGMDDASDDVTPAAVDTTGDLDDLDNLLGDIETPAAAASEVDDLDSLLADLDGDSTAEPTSDNAGDDLDALFAESDDTDASEDEDDDLDALLNDLGGDDTAEDDTPEDDGADTGLDDLDALLAGMDDETDGGGTDDLDDSLTDEPSTPASAAAPKPVAQSPFGLISAPRPDRDGLKRPKFRIAMFGDFTGRSARGLMETGDALAARKPIELDVDTIEEIIEGFGTTLTLPIGKGGSGVEIKLKELDDLHPDELYDNVELFSGIAGLRQQLSVGSMVDKAVEKLQAWSETYATPIKLPKTSASTSIPANVKLSDFQALIGDTSGTLTQAGPIDNLIAQIVGPHIVKNPDRGADAMKACVDDALSSAMRLVLHHPDFQALEAQWRSLDLLARRIETDSALQIILYDVSAEELAVDLAANEDLSQSGFFRLLTDVLDPEEGTGGFSALCGLYTFEETPPHAELLARIGQVGAHVDAPFFTSISPSYLDVAKEDRHPLVAKAWDTLRDLPEAAYIALASPRFLLRLPYGAKSDPVYPFNFEEFTPKEGLKGMLWANPVVLVAILLAGTFKKDGKAMDLGSLMSLGDLPFHYVSDRYGDQVALPCTERNLTSEPVQTTLGRGYMPVVWMKGRNEVRLASFRSLAGDMIAGPWSSHVPAPRPGPGKAPLDLEMTSTLGGDAPDEDQTSEADIDLDDLLGRLDDDSGDNDGDMDLDDLLGGLDDDDDDDDTDLDDLLASFADDSDDDSDDDDDMDPELAALLEGL